MSGANASATFDILSALRRMQALLASGEAAQAEQLCRQVVAQCPGELDALRLLGAVANAGGDVDAPQRSPRQPVLPPEASAVCWSDLADVYRRKGLLAEAEAAARQSVAMDSRLAAGWSRLGTVLKDIGKLEESRAAFERAVALKPECADAHNDLGNALRELGLPSFAAWHYIQAIAADRNHAQAHANIASFHIGEGDYEQAAAAAQRAIELNPRLADAYLKLAEAQMLCHRYDVALGALDALVAVSPGHAAARTVRETLLAQIERCDETLWESHGA